MTFETNIPDHASAVDRLDALFAGDSLLPLWIAEPYVALAPPVRRALEHRAASGWYGYEARPAAITQAFWDWMEGRHQWDGAQLFSSISPSVGTSIGVLLEHYSDPGDGVILQPPVFTDFKPLIRAANRSAIRSSLLLEESAYKMDLNDLEAKTADPAAKVLILCNPHNPVGRQWTRSELELVASICAENDVLVIADEIHADLVLGPHPFIPFATVAAGTGVRWSAIHGPLKTFGLAGVCDTLLITDDDEITERFRTQSSRLHLTRNNVFGLAAFEAAYRDGAEWLDDFLEQIRANVALLENGLPEPLRVIRPEATYLAWLDLRGLRLDVPALARWLSQSGLALSPGHWFGREGAGFARMTIAAPATTIEEAITRLSMAIG